MEISKLPSRTAIDAELRYRAEHKLDSFYPETGQLRRELYVKHMEFFERGAEKNERLFMAANRVGKSEGVGAYELTLHLTGKYPPGGTGAALHGLSQHGRPAKTRKRLATSSSLRCLGQARNTAPA